MNASERISTGADGEDRADHASHQCPAQPRGAARGRASPLPEVGEDELR